MDEYDWLVFTSGNGVDGLLNRIFEKGGDIRSLGRVQLAALGKGTAERLAHFHLKADVNPEKVDPASLAQTLLEEAPGNGRIHF